ncbi:MAG TPA: hypothetical protein VJL29_03890, partial [Thermoguttaceae bacterium]|nr:hypothetical protein [Thermoguttaceae bacterium]
MTLSPSVAAMNGLFLEKIAAGVHVRVCRVLCGGDKGMAEACIAGPGGKVVRKSVVVAQRRRSDLENG